MEDAIILPSGKWLRDTTCGNPIWRSPESWARAKQGTPSDVFSFGIVAVYVVLKNMVFRATDEELAADDAWWHVLTRHVNLFATEDGFKGLLHCTSDILAPLSSANFKEPRVIQSVFRVRPS